MKQELEQAIASKKDRDIVVVGKGQSVDDVDLSLLNDCVVINVNDSELIFAGDIAVFHHGWVLDVFDESPPRCRLYISDKVIPGNVPQVQVEYIYNTPESSEFMLNRFFSDSVYIEHAPVVSALRIAEEIARIEDKRKNVYLLGFDFSTKDGFSSKIPNASSRAEPEYQERVISGQEQLMQMILEENDRLNINIIHIGAKSYSRYSVESFNRVFATRHGMFVEKMNKPVKQDVPEGEISIVAECTTNHFGDMDRLKSMIDSAKQAGADYVKFQKRDVETFYSEEQLAASYRSPFGSTFRDYRHGIELNRDQFYDVDSYCKEVGIDWFVSILDWSSYQFMREFDLSIIKLPSTISEHKEFIVNVSSDFDRDIVLSTGYTDKRYEEYILRTFKKARTLYLLQCTSAYPTLSENAQIGMVRHYYNLSNSNSNIVPGYSSHDIGSLCSMMAVAAGARMIEKHVKLGDVSWSHFDDVAVDLVNGDFRQFVEDVRHAERIVGDEEKRIQPNEHHKYWVNG